MENLLKQKDMQDEYLRLESAIASNKRYLLATHLTANLQCCDEVYSALIKTQERLLREIAGLII